MAQVPDRDALEGKLARLLGRLSRAQMGRLLEELGDPPAVENVSPLFWDETGKELANAIRPFLEDVYLESARRLMNSQSVGVEWGGVNETAADWASSHSYDLIRKLEDTSRKRVQGAISRYYRDEQTIGELERSLTPTFGPVRAEMIAVTEVTRASVEGERGMVQELAKEGIEMRPFWETNNDELVCPICEPRNGKEITDGFYPPAHPRCRCTVGHEIVRTEEDGAG